MDIIQELEKLRRSHYKCEDCWYSCPKCEDGCCDDGVEDDSECLCGTDRHNAILDKIIKHIKSNG